MRIHVLGLTQGTYNSRCVGGPVFRDCLNQAWTNNVYDSCEDDVTFESCYLSTKNIYEIVNELPVRSVLMIYANRGISDYANQTAIDSVLQLAIRKHVQVGKSLYG
jgi:hypothetical protein